MALIILTSPTSEPVTLAEIKQHLNITHTDDDGLLLALGESARHQAENYMKRQIMPATWKYIISDFPSSTGKIELMRPPLSTVSSNVSIEYIDNTNSTQTVASTVYNVDYETVPGYVEPAYANEWPSDVLTDRNNSVKITFVSGYNGKANVPQPIKRWIMMRVGAMYEYREDLTPDVSNVLPHEYAMGLLDPYKIIRFGT